MPFYSVKCQKCGCDYDVMSMMYKMDETIAEAACEECGSKDKERVITGVNFNFSNPVGTDRWNNSHDYRFKHKLPSVQGERDAAEAASKVGDTQ